MGEEWEILAGLNKVFWGVAESRHQVEDIDEEDKLGQPMLNLTTLRDWGTVSLFILPGFSEACWEADLKLQYLPPAAGHPASLRQRLVRLSRHAVPEVCSCHRKGHVPFGFSGIPAGGAGDRPETP